MVIEKRNISSERTPSREAEFGPMTGIHPRVSRRLRKNIDREKTAAATSPRDATTCSQPHKKTAQRKAVPLIMDRLNGRENETL
jgi:hypothetical protein